MPVSLRNRTQTSNNNQKGATSNSKQDSAADKKGQAKSTSTLNNKPIDSSKIDSSKATIQTRGKQRQIIEMFPKKIIAQQKGTTRDTTAAGSTVQQAPSNISSNSLEMTVISKKRKRDEFEKTHEQPSATALEKHPKQTTKRLPPRVVDQEESTNLIELSPDKQSTLEQKQTKKNQRKMVQVIEAVVIAGDADREPLHQNKVEDKIEAKKSRNRGKTTVPDKKSDEVEPAKVVNITKPTMVKLTPGLFEKAVPFNDPELQLHRKLQASDPSSTNGRSNSVGHMHIPHPLLSQCAVVIFPTSQMRLISLYPEQTHAMLSEERKRESSESDLVVIENFLKEFPSHAELHNMHMKKHMVASKLFLEPQFSATMNHLMKINSSQKKQ